MDQSTLAKELRARQISVGLVEEDVISRISDKEIIDCYITCSCCDEKSVSSSTYKGHRQLQGKFYSKRQVNKFLRVACLGC